MYSVKGNLVLAFHGCDKSVRDKIIKNPNRSLHFSENSYDWLGHGIYFWENNPDRALEYARKLQKNPRKGKKLIKEPSVLGAVIQLGLCLDLMNSYSLQIVKRAHELLRNSTEKSAFESLKNKHPEGTTELLIRELDCAVIETLHKTRKASDNRPFDSVRAVFFEGDDLYPTAGFKEKNHIQICVRIPNCIKGYFIPRKENSEFVVP